MAGGYGERFWPLSTRECPKQFLDILGTGRSLLQSAYRRARMLAQPENIWVVTAEEHVALTKAQLPELPPHHAVGEPQRRNTAPCIALAASLIEGEGNVVILPSDHLVEDDRAFTQCIEAACQIAMSRECTTTIGISPTRPETGYGYIERNEPIPSNTPGNSRNSAPKAYSVRAFKEKPTAETAQEYLSDGKHLWNSGMFIWSLNTLRALLQDFTPDIWQAFHPVRATDRPDLKAIYRALPSISIDYALLEKTPDIAVVEAQFGWNDLGTYSSVARHLPHDSQGNASLGKVLALDSANCVIYNTGQKPIIAAGLSNYIVAQSEEGLLICPISREQQVKNYVTRLNEAESTK